MDSSSSLNLYSIITSHGTYDYVSDITLIVGMRVIVPLRRKKVVGIVQGQSKWHKPEINYRSIIKILDGSRVVDQHHMAFLEYMTSSCKISMSDLLRLTGSRIIFREQANYSVEKYYFLRDLATREIKLVHRLHGYKKQIKSGVLVLCDNYDFQNRDYKLPIELNLTQKRCVDIIISYCVEDKPKPILLHGVTGSGKTVIYTYIIQKQISLGKQVLILVPEINLLYPLKIYLQNMLPRLNITTFCSEDTLRSKWKKINAIRGGITSVIISTRSGVFLNIPSLGIIIIDEEHAESFQQEMPPYYNAKRIAMLRGITTRIPVLLGSGTPSLFTLYQVMHKNCHYVQMNKPFYQGAVSSLKIAPVASAKDQLFHASVHKEINEHLARKKQILIIHNKLGYWRMGQCKACFSPLICKKCGRFLIVNEQKRSLFSCRTCAYNLPFLCPNCYHTTFEFSDYGTEQLTSFLKELFPGKRIARLDSQTSGITQVLTSIHKQEVDLIVATQIIVKGHDFAHVSLVIINDIDSHLQIEKIHRLEKLAQMIYQARGRCGRRGQKSVTIIPTQYPHHHFIKQIVQGSYVYVCNFLLSRALNLRQPPFYKGMRVYHTSSDDAQGYGNLVSISALIRSTVVSYKMEKVFNARYGCWVTVLSFVSSLRNLLCNINRIEEWTLCHNIQVHYEFSPYNY